jgi:membrane-bound metal-dependent hydrolase YbcI (DUF457 family)
MLIKTHLAIGIFAAVFFLPHINNKLIFVPVVLIASILPDIDTGFSTLGKKRLFKPVQLLAKHRGIFHSFTLCVIVSVIFAFYLPILAFSFFLGYAIHLFADSWTLEGIKPFWPFKTLLKGHVKVGGIIEETVFMTFIVLDIIFLVLLLA